MMSPLVADDGRRPGLVAGAAGGSRIRSALLQVLVNVLHSSGTSPVRSARRGSTRCPGRSTSSPASPRACWRGSRRRRGRAVAGTRLVLRRRGRDRLHRPRAPIPRRGGDVRHVASASSRVCPCRTPGAPAARLLSVSRARARATQAVVAVVVAALRGGGDRHRAGTLWQRQHHAGGSGGTQTAPSSPAPTSASASAPPSSMRLQCRSRAEHEAAELRVGAESRARQARHLGRDLIETNCGDIAMELDGRAAPQTVSSFVFLAQKGFFDNSPCHRLTTSGLYVLQCGDPTGTGTGGPGLRLRHRERTASTARTPQARWRWHDLDPRTATAASSSSCTRTRPCRPGRRLLDLRQGHPGTGDRQGTRPDRRGGGGADGAPAQPISILHVHVKKA